MGRIKVPRKSTAVDMTAMCDVAFLLLTFFILTATSRQPDPLDIKIPSSTVAFKVPDKDLTILSIGHGKVFVEVIGQDVKKLALQKMADHYGVKFTPKQVDRFKVVSSFGVPITRLAQYIDMTAEQRTKSGIESGIPTTDTTANGELHQWVLQARNAVAELHNVPMLVSIKGDADEEYPTVRKIIDILQRQKINKFSLITSAEVAAK